MLRLVSHSVSLPATTQQRRSSATTVGPSAQGVSDVVKVWQPSFISTSRASLSTLGTSCNGQKGQSFRARGTLATTPPGSDGVGVGVGAGRGDRDGPGTCGAQPRAALATPT